MTLTWLLLTACLTTAPPVRTAEIAAAAQAHYDSLLAGKALQWRVEMQRCPAVKGDSFQIIAIRGDETTPLPRGSRLCRVTAAVDGRTRMIPVTVKVMPIELVPVAKADIPARTPLADSLIEWRTLATEELGAALLPRGDGIQELWAKARIPAGTIVTMKRLAPMPAVVVDQEVTLVGRAGLVEVRTRGRALEDGRIGEKIRVENLSSGRRLKGRVCTAGVLVVE